MFTFFTLIWAEAILLRGLKQNYVLLKVPSLQHFLLAEASVT